MDFDALVQEIVSRVAAKIDESAPATTIVCDDKPRLLILTQQHGTLCHAMLESDKLREYYHTECALMCEYQCDPSAYEAVVLFGLTNDVLGKLDCGVCDTPFTSLAQKLILSGKKVFIPEEEIELFKYEQTAPPAYYAMMRAKLEFLRSAGVTFCSSQALEEVILTGEACVPSAACAPAAVKPAPKLAAVEASIPKKVISEKDVVAAFTPGVTAIRVPKNAIFTDLARDYAKMHRIQIIRD